MLVSLVEAQRLFDALPAHLRVPTLSPAYVAADSTRVPDVEPLFLVWHESAGFMMHAVHEARVPGRTECDWQSAYGYGGPIAHGLSDEALSEAWSAFDRLARERRVIAESLRFHPLLANHRYYPGSVRVDRAVVSVGLKDGDLSTSYAGRTRTAIRKALAHGLTAQWESAKEALAYFPHFYRRGMVQIGAAAFYLFPDEYFRALLGLPYARVLSVQRDGERLSMGLFLFGPEVVEYHLSATAMAGREHCATNLLLHEAALRARDEGCSTLYLGGGKSMAEDDPLLRFKSSFARPDLRFHVGYRVHDPEIYETLRLAHPELARTSWALFYRG